MKSWEAKLNYQEVERHTFCKARLIVSVPMLRDRAGWLTEQDDHSTMTIVTNYYSSMSLPLTLSKSKFKPQALEYLRMVEKTNQPIVITNFGKPSVKIVPYTPKVDQVLAELKGSVISYEDPFKSVGLDDWEDLP